MKNIPLLLVLALPILAGEPPNINCDESKEGPVVLPEVLLTAQGAKVTSARQWEQQRRGEVWQLFQEHDWRQYLAFAARHFGGAAPR